MSNCIRFTYETRVKQKATIYRTIVCIMALSHDKPDNLNIICFRKSQICWQNATFREVFAFNLCCLILKWLCCDWMWWNETREREGEKEREREKQKLKKFHFFALICIVRFPHQFTLHSKMWNSLKIIINDGNKILLTIRNQFSQLLFKLMHS